MKFRCSRGNFLEALALAGLKKYGPIHGYGLVKLIKLDTGVDVSSSLSTTLIRLEKMGYVSKTIVNEKFTNKKKNYEITLKGKLTLKKYEVEIRKISNFVTVNGNGL